MKIVNVEKVDSTMDAVKNYDFNTLLIADEQTRGRGKENRTWISNKSNNLYLGILIKADNNKINYFNYTFLSAISVIKSVEFLSKQKHNLKVKWPNDVLLNNKKFCGILLEKDGEKLVIGIGINVDYYPENTNFPATSLKNEGCIINKEDLVDEFSKNFEILSKELLTSGFNNIRKTWLDYAYNLNKKITVSNRDNLEGVFKDLSEDGTLILETDDNKIHRISSGDIF